MDETQPQPTRRLLAAVTHDGSAALADLSAGVAGGIATGLPLLAGIIAGWTVPRIAAYSVLATLYFAMLWLYRSDGPLNDWLCAHNVVGLGLAGLICAGLVVISGDSFIQPIVFTVPFVYGLMVFGLPRATILGAYYLSLLAAALWFSGERDLTGIVYPVGVYGALLFFMTGFVRLAQDQAAARLRADALARELAAERDALAALAAENARLASENALAATLAERNRIARELHDTIAQSLTAVAMQIEAADRAFDRDQTRARARLARAQTLARETLAEVRRSVWTLAAPVVEGEALGHALADLTARFGARTGIEAGYRHEGAPLSLDSERSAQLLRIVQEAMQNVEKHAAASHVEVGTLHTPTGDLTVWVRDDGCGFDPTSPLVVVEGGGFGLHSLRERARLAGAALAIESAPGHGATVTVTIPGS